MNEIRQIMRTIKSQLKLQGKTYRDVAEALALSEASVKRILREENAVNLSLERILQIAHFLGLTLMELTQEANHQGNRLPTLNQNQEKELVADKRLLLVAVCAINHWSMEEIMQVYRYTEPECLHYLLKLDKLGLITLLPGNRIRLNITRDFEWLPAGPIRQYFQQSGLHDFLDSHFHDDEQTLSFSHGMLTEAAISKLHSELRQLKRKFADLHQESLAAPLKKRRGVGLLLASREWEPAEFTGFRRLPGKAK
ncbi:helix-turn-helix domain-containing protein [Undibacterium curvum]|jgi:transcriptional regulator with XRE-family HTH domain|uniref:Helix-turn-helix transcriptional regulator n=1 Tax=Undibacterium curvum TaxID=2762294 RepID=A0ABR6ZZQ3_9BURK|nr:helix-turn-helix transcriptional regulator [Undibacterium curvum]MBC3930149.1 helix-turn-helix transcriptional regulator [Undibacterium curvum]